MIIIVERENKKPLHMHTCLTESRTDVWISIRPQVIVRKAMIAQQKKQRKRRKKEKHCFHKMYRSIWSNIFSIKFHSSHFIFGSDFIFISSIANINCAWAMWDPISYLQTCRKRKVQFVQIRTNESILIARARSFLLRFLLHRFTVRWDINVLRLVMIDRISSCVI